MPVKCPIWQTDATEVPLAGGIDALAFDSPRAGGRYAITGSAVASLSGRTVEDLLKLTTWLVDQRRLGSETPMIDTGVLRQAAQSHLLDDQERRDRILSYIRSKCSLVSDHIDWPASVTPERRTVTDQLMAWSQSRSSKEVGTLIKYAREDGLLEEGALLRLTFKGRAYLASSESSAAQRSSQCFVAMWFDASTDTAYSEGIAPAVTEAGYRPFRIDGKEHANKIDDEIVAEIRRSRFVVADFTCGLSNGVGIARGGVYYEAGFAMGLGIPVIWCCSASAIDHVHFDTRQYNHIVWNEPSDLKQKLARRISALLGDGPLRDIDIRTGKR